MQRTGVPCARHFAQLVWLLREEPSNVDDQKTALRALVADMKHGHVLLDVSEGHLTANGVVTDDLSACGHTLLTQLAAHGVDAVAIAERSPPKALLDVARHLASTSLSDASDGLFDAWPVCLVRRDPATPDASSPHRPATSEHHPPISPVPSATLSPASAPPPPIHERNEFAGSMFEHFSVQRTASSAQIEELLRKLDASTDRTRLEAVLGRLSVQVESAVAGGETELACAVLCRIAARELQLGGGRENDRTFRLTIRRLARGHLVRGIASRLPVMPADREPLLAILAHAGEEGAEAVIDQLVDATDRRHRRVYFDTLTHLKAGVTSLIHMLGDTRWFVARNAAELLGRIGAHEAEDALCGLATHPDERVRASAVAALVQLNTPRARGAVIAALGDSAPAVRLFAAGALVADDSAQAAPALQRALDGEEDEEVHVACLAALGRLGTSDAVEQLIVYAQPSRGLFKRNPVPIRVAALHALGRVRTPAARAALETVKEESGREIRQAARDALAAHGGRKRVAAS